MFKEFQSNEDTEEEVGMDEDPVKEEEEDEEEGGNGGEASTQRRSRSPIRRLPPSLPTDNKAKVGRGGRHGGLPPSIKRKRTSTPIPVTKSPPKKAKNRQVVAVDVEDRDLSKAAMVSSPSSLRANGGNCRHNESGEGPSHLHQVVRHKKQLQQPTKKLSLPPVDEEEEGYIGLQINPWARLDDFEELTDDGTLSLNVTGNSSSRAKKSGPTLAGSDDESSFLAPSTIAHSSNSSLEPSDVVELGDDNNDDDEDDGGAHDRRRLAIIAKLGALSSGGSSEQKTA